jgi:hypothetical protein
MAAAAVHFVGECVKKQTFVCFIAKLMDKNEEEEEAKKLFIFCIVKLSFSRFYLFINFPPLTLAHTIKQQL